MNSEITRFGHDVAASSALQGELKAAGSDLDAVVRLAQSKGYQFSVADVRSAGDGGGELSESQLDGVAGGVGGNGMTFLGNPTSMVLVNRGSYFYW